MSSSLLRFALLGVLGYFVIARRSRIASWLLLLSVLLALYVHTMWDDYDLYFATVACGSAAVAGLLHPQARDWTGAP